jgi:hypothetical protein
LQAALIKHVVEEQGLDRDYFGTVDHLCRLVLKENWPQEKQHKPVLTRGSAPDPPTLDQPPARTRISLSAAVKETVATRARASAPAGWARVDAGQ